ncbi:MAG: hypothetical protein FWD83_02330 [Promicromonosporaceae bacterium]|nr:hypothetical protein [Promicromonosporaceae bacterium]
MSASADYEAERGRILLLSLGLTVLGLLLVAVTASAATVHLDHKRLHNLADLLATAVLAEISPFDDAPLPDVEVRLAVEAELVTYPSTARTLTNLQVFRAEQTDAFTVTLTLTATSHPPLLAWFTTPTDTGFPIEATATATLKLTH